MTNREYSTMHIHIGERIKEVLLEKGHNACWLSERIPCERSNVYHIFKRCDIGIELLFRISEILDHDFFAELSEELRQGDADGQ